MTVPRPKGRKATVRPASAKSYGRGTCPICHKRFVKKTKNHEYNTPRCRFEAWKQRMIQAELEKVFTKTI